jgi:para-nitrobenzyl esterase
MLVKKKFLPFFLLLFVLSWLRGAAQWDRVQVEGGVISGTTDPGGDLHIFKGIPFAAPPVGDLRWRAPQPVIPWQGVRRCDSFGASPMQGKPVPFMMWTQEFLIPAAPISEDCLYLNVWTGAKTPGERRPVLVWIYGGGFGSGGAGCPIYDGAATAKKGVVFVSINYRVGVFGFFAHPDLSLESGHHASGDYGLMDQIAALKWVQQNIAAFGGDPNLVTVAGQSAGSMSVNCLTASPLARGLFKRVIAESGAQVLGENTALLTAENAGQNLMQKLNLTSIKDLRAMSATELFAKAQGSWRPVVDGYVLPDAIGAIYRNHKENPADLLTGWTEDEISPQVKNATDFQKDVLSRYKNLDSPAVFTYYPALTDSEAAVSQRRFERDMTFGVQNYTWANWQSTYQSTPELRVKVYVYRFTRKVPATGEYKKYGAFHTGEVPYAYDNLQFVNRPWEPVDHSLATAMSDYWVNFVKTGDPNGNGLPHWDAYSEQDKTILFLGDKVVSGPLPDVRALDYLASKMH